MQQTICKSTNTEARNKFPLVTLLYVPERGLNHDAILIASSVF